MHQILEIDKRTSFYTINVERGGKYLTSKNKQKVQ